MDDSELPTDQRSVHSQETETGPTNAEEQLEVSPGVLTDGLIQKSLSDFDRTADGESFAYLSIAMTVCRDVRSFED